MFELCRQYLAIGILVTGWGYWVWKFTSKKTGDRKGWPYWCGLAGFVLQVLLLQQVYYLGVKVGISAWCSFAVGLTGVIRVCYEIRARFQAPVLRMGTGTVAVAILVVLLFQSLSLLLCGPKHYFGRAETDQVNYVYTAQVAEEEGFTHRGDRIMLQPWLARARASVEERMTQSIVHAEISVLSATDAQQAWGATTVAFLFLLCLAIAGALAEWRIVGWRCAAVILAVGVCPAVTQVMLDCFLSQESVMWILVALPGLLVRARLGDFTRVALVGLFLGYSLGSYTEYFAVGYAAVICCIFLSRPFRTAFFHALFATGICALTTAMFLPYAVRFFHSQLAVGMKQDYAALWYALSGTWAGWGENFILSDNIAFKTIFGVGLTALFFAGIFAVRPIYRLRLLLLVCGPLIFLIGVRLAPTFPKYAYGKLMSLSTPATLVAVAIVGNRATRFFSVGVSGLIGVIGVCGFFSGYKAHRDVASGYRLVAAADLPVRARLSALNQNEKWPVVVVSENRLVTAWLVYYLRNVDTYILFSSINDRMFPSLTSPFRKIPAKADRIIAVDSDQIQETNSFEPFPQVDVTGGIWVPGEGCKGWASSGGEISVELRFKDASREYKRWLEFEVCTDDSAPAMVVVVTSDRSSVVQPHIRYVVPLMSNKGSVQAKFRSRNGRPFILRVLGPEPVLQNREPPYGFTFVPRENPLSVTF